MARRGSTARDEIDIFAGLRSKSTIGRKNGSLGDRTKFFIGFHVPQMTIAPGDPALQKKFLEQVQKQIQANVMSGKDLNGKSLPVVSRKTHERRKYREKQFDRAGTKTSAIQRKRAKAQARRTTKRFSKQGLTGSALREQVTFFVKDTRKKVKRGRQRNTIEKRFAQKIGGKTWKPGAIGPKRRGAIESGMLLMGLAVGPAKEGFGIYFPNARAIRDAKDGSSAVSRVFGAKGVLGKPIMGPGFLKQPMIRQAKKDWLRSSIRQERKMAMRELIAALRNSYQISQGIVNDTLYQ